MTTGNRIERVFAEKRSSGAKALMPFVCAGYPDLGSSLDAIPKIEQAGGSIVEIGIPFSDPIADGPTIAAAMHEALEAGVTPTGILERVASIREKTEMGLVAMVSVSIVHRIGIGKFVKMASDAGIDGFIFPDAPVDEASDLGTAAREHGLTMSLLVAPTTSVDRAGEIAALCSGFVYVLTRAGITGADAGGPSAQLADRIAALRTVTDLPLACGFGIASPDDVRTVVAHADAAIVGSELVKRMGASEDAAREAGDFTAELAAGLIQPVS